MENLEGLWTVSFQSNFQTFGTGVGVFIRDRILGGDSFYYYDGNVKISQPSTLAGALGGGKAEATIKVVRFNKAGVAIFGNLDSFTLKVAGDFSTSSMELHGNMVEQPNMKITIKGQKITSI
jgi:hypothetical protein